MRRIALQLCAVLVGLQIFFPLPGMDGIARAVDEWQEEFNTVCGKTQNALAFSVDELNDLIGRCDALRPRIESLGASQASQRKVFLQRLKRCRDFYGFALEAKADKGP